MPNQSTSTSTAPQTLLMRRYASLTDSHGRAFGGTWPDACNFLATFNRRGDKGGGLFSFTELRPGKSRARENVLRVRAFVGDLDHGDHAKLLRTVELLKLAGIDAAISSTFRHRPEAPRVRVVLRLSRPVLLAEWESFWAAVNARFELNADEKSRDPGHLFYDPIAPPGAKMLFWRNDGKPLDVDEMLANAPRVPPRPRLTGADWNALLDNLNEGNRDSGLTQLAGLLFGSTLPATLAAKLLHLANEQCCRPPLQLEQVTKIAHSVARREASKLEIVRGPL